MGLFGKNKNKNLDAENDEIEVTDEEIVETDLVEDADNFYTTVYEEIEVGPDDEDDEDVDINDLLDEEDRLEKPLKGDELDELLDEEDRLDKSPVSADGKVVNLEFARKALQEEKDEEFDDVEDIDDDYDDSDEDIDDDYDDSDEDIDDDDYDESEEDSDDDADAEAPAGERNFYDFKTPGLEEIAEEKKAASDEEKSEEADTEDEEATETADKVGLSVVEPEDESKELEENSPVKDNIEEIEKFTAAKSENSEEEKEKAAKKKKTDTLTGFIGIMFLVVAAVAGMAVNKASKKLDANNAGTKVTPTAAADPATKEDYSWWEDRDVSADVSVGDELAAYAKGSRIFFGSFTQGAEGEVEDLAWKVLEVENGYALLVSEYIIDARAFDADGVIQWENSDLRAWLNDEFYKEAFSAEEQALIAQFEIENSDNADFSTDGGHDTEDRVFLLSQEDIDDYFDGVELTASATPYTKEKGIASSSTTGDIYWTRSPGCMDISTSEPGYVATVSNTGNLYMYGNDSTYTNIGVRPVIWIKISE